MFVSAGYCDLRTNSMNNYKIKILRQHRTPSHCDSINSSPSSPIPRAFNLILEAVMASKINPEVIFNTISDELNARQTVKNYQQSVAKNSKQGGDAIEKAQCPTEAVPTKSNIEVEYYQPPLFPLWKSPPKFSGRKTRLAWERNPHFQ